MFSAVVTACRFRIYGPDRFGCAAALAVPVAPEAASPSRLVRRLPVMAATDAGHAEVIVAFTAPGTPTVQVGCGDTSHRAVPAGSAHWAVNALREFGAANHCA